MRAGAIFIPILLAQGVVARAVRSRDFGGSRRNGTQRPGSGGRNGSPQAVAPGEGCSATGKAVYFLTNDDENSVVALTINGDGTLRKGSVTSAGGKGSISLDGATGEPAVNDGLVSQGSLTIAGQHLFAVNAGSNTVAMMAISEGDPTKLSMVGQPVAVPGEFPNTVAASTKNGLACVAATGAVAGISCASFTAEGGLGEMDDLRPIDLGQSTPPVGPTNTVSHTFFSEDESTLFTMVKGDPAANKTGFVSMLEIGARKGCDGTAPAAAAPKDVRSSPAGTAVLFGSQVIPGSSDIFATDASFGGAVLSVDAAGGAVTVAGQAAIDGQAATCWSAFSAATGSVFVTDVGVPRIVEMSARDAGVIRELDLAETDAPGFIDLGAAGSFVYALAPGNGSVGAAIAVLDVSGGQGSARLVQRFSLDGLVGASAQGIAILS